MLSSPFGAMAASATPLSHLSDKGSWGDLAAYPGAAPRGSDPAEAAWSSRPLPPSQNPKKGPHPGQSNERVNGWASQRRPPVPMPQPPQPQAQGEALERLAYRQCGAPGASADAGVARQLPPHRQLPRAAALGAGRAAHRAAALTLTPDTVPAGAQQQLLRAGPADAAGAGPGCGAQQAGGGAAAGLRRPAAQGLSAVRGRRPPCRRCPSRRRALLPPGTPLLQPLLHSEPSALTSLGSVGSGALRAGLSGLGSRLGSELGSGALSCDAVLLEELSSSPVLGCITAAQAAEREAMWQALRKRLEQQPPQNGVP